ncbi:hypothetical protein GGI15_001349 [Coemansia interrupta]|uniref:non-specific serine/threonine protein kinase n=1 Tax=Coemansia interrupta TaxID=1126814 RepID=A0A9W8HI49_9FUNG|nr:hypothetical protein GGI15_001349 [Coemansia interrupta]
MGRLSLAIGRHKESSSKEPGDAHDGGATRSKQFRTSLKGFLRLPVGDEQRASIDLGDIREMANEDGTPRHSLSAKPSSSNTRGHTGSSRDKASEAPGAAISVSAHPASSVTSAKAITASSPEKQDLQAPNLIADQHSVQADVSQVHTDAAIASSSANTAAATDAAQEMHAGCGTATATTTVTAPAEEHATEDQALTAAALARYSMISDKIDGINWNGEPEDSEKLSWRRRGSLLSSKLAAPLRKDGAARVLIRKESTPLFSGNGHRNHHLFHRSGSSESGGGVRSSFWRGGNSSNSNSSSNLNNAASGSSANREPGTDLQSQQHSITSPRVAETRTERTHRSSSVPFFTPILSPGSGRPSASPYLRAVGSGVVGSSSSGSSGRLNRNDLQMSLANTRQAIDRFPKLSMMGGSESGSPAGLPSPAAHSNDGTVVAAAMPMTFLVSPRPRASTTSKHVLSRVATNSQEFRHGKRTLSSATIPVLELNVPASPRALAGAVDMSEFGVGSSELTAPSTASKSPLLPPSPISTSTPARSVSSVRFEAPQDSANDDQAAAEEPADDSQSSDAVHETHRMQVVHDPYTGRKMINQYMIIRELGRGTHGKVKLAFDTVTGEYFAIKIIDKESRDRRLRLGAPARTHGNTRIDMDKMEKVKREIAILKKCRHPNVVRLREVIDDAHARRIYLVIEFMDGGEIRWRDDDGLPAMDASEARSVFRDLVLGVEYLHYAGVLHRDLKPQNLLCNKAGRVKISDFGVSFLSRRQEKPRKPRNTNPPSIVVDGKAPSPLRPAGRAPALQGSLLHRYASQPLMSSSLALQHRNSASALRHKASVLSKEGSILAHSSRHTQRSVSSAGISLRSSAGSHSRNQLLEDQFLRPLGPPSQSDSSAAGMGMTDEFGNASSEQQPQSAPISPSHAMAAPAFKMPPESLSADSNVYDPFDSSDSNEFFSSDSESDYGSVDEDKSDDEDDDEDGGGIVFGAGNISLVEPPAPSSPSARPRHARKGTLGEIDCTYNEKDEERELAKTAGTPAFFAPELCCTAEELARVLKDERARRLAHARLVSRHRGRHNTDPVAAPTPQLDSEVDDRPVSGSGARPSSLYVEASQVPRLAKRHSTIVSLLARPFSPKARLSSIGSTSSASIHSSAAPLPEDAEAGEDPSVDEPLPANVITPAIDIWAMGVTLYCLVFGRVPFRASNEFELFNIIPRRAIEFPLVLEASSESDVTRTLPPLDPDLQDLLTRLLDKDFRTRITIEQIKQHPWVVRDLDHPSSWAQETDPAHRPSLNVTSQEVAQAVVPKQREQKGFRASVRRRISQMQSTATKTKSSLDWLKIW